MTLQEVQLGEFFINNRHNSFGNHLILQLFAVLFTNGILVVFFDAQFFFDDFQLFLEYIFAMLLLDFFLYFPSNFLLEPGEFQLLFE